MPRSQKQRQYQRPQQVELLLHAEGPRVPDGVGQLPEGQRVVVDVKCGEHGRQPAIFRRPEDGGQPHVDRDHEQQRRIQPQRPARVETADLDAAVAVLRRQQRSDEIARQDEEDVQPDEAAMRTGDLAVEQDHREDGQRANAVERGVVGQGHLSALSEWPAGPACTAAGSWHRTPDSLPAP
ncbi:hypothetical protein D9M72_520880 [compost metagenome]